MSKTTEVRIPIKMYALKTVNPQPGDVVVVNTGDEFLNPQTARSVLEEVKAVFPDNEVIIVCGELEISLRDGKSITD